jgi:hypothetical protein
MSLCRSCWRRTGRGSGCNCKKIVVEVERAAIIKGLLAVATEALLVGTNRARSG